jgi:KH domain
MLLNGEISFYNDLPASIRIRCEMALELKEFVSGKKLGKVNKITKSSNCHIAFENYSEYNFLIDITSSGLREIADGYKQLLEEFPAELYWFVPEEYHKRIIGVQGKTIQRIMKHYSVYVKFFNALEFAAAGGDSKTEDNVLARTPAKNAAALQDCKKAVLEMVFQNVSPMVNCY